MTQNTKNPSLSAFPRNRYTRSQIRRQTRHGDAAEPAYLTSLKPSEHDPIPLLSNTQNVLDGKEPFHCRNTQGTDHKSVNVLSTLLTSPSKMLTSQSVQHREGDNTDHSATICASNPFPFPDPCKPPVDQDNTSIWKAVMAAKSKLGAHIPTVAQLLLELLGEELDPCTKYLSGEPDVHFGGCGPETPPVAKYVKMYSGEEADDFAAAMGYFIQSKHSESDLCDYLKGTIFTTEVSLEPWTRRPDETIPFDQKAIVRRSEYNSNFQSYDISELRTGLADIRHIRLSPKERLEGHTTADTPNLLPAETDLRGRCDMAFGIDESCSDSLLNKDINSYLPCYNPSAGVCAIWLRAEFKKTNDQGLIKAARHQWAVGAFLELQYRVRLARDTTRSSYLSDSSSTKDLRHYGYVICGAYVEIWEMYVACSVSTQDRTRRETNYYEHYFRFPARKLAGLRLTSSKGIEQFCKWHAKIMDWGFNVYSRQYLDNVALLAESSLPLQDWVLSYEDAMGREIPSLPAEEQESGRLQPPTGLSYDVCEC